MKIFEEMIEVIKKLSKKEKLLYIFTFVFVLFSDQITKAVVNYVMQLGQSQEIVPNFFYFTYAHNFGAAWGMLRGRIGLFVIVSILAAGGLFYYFAKTKENDLLTRFGITLVYAGLFGNLIDRLWLGYVRDFIDFVILKYDFPVFNIADMGVVIGVFLICIEVFFEDRLDVKTSDNN